MRLGKQDALICAPDQQLDDSATMCHGAAWRLKEQPGRKKEGFSSMVHIINILDVGITILVPAVVWSLLAVGLFELIRESIHGFEGHRRVIRTTRS